MGDSKAGGDAKVAAAAATPVHHAPNASMSLALEAAGIALHAVEDRINKQIREFIASIQPNSLVSKRGAIKDFARYFLRKLPDVNSDDIRYLYTGSTTSSLLAAAGPAGGGGGGGGSGSSAPRKGLLDIVGSGVIGPNSEVAVLALELVYLLLDSETNTATAPLCLQVLTKLDITQLMAMRLDAHILSEGSNHQEELACKIIYVLSEHAKQWAIAKYVPSEKAVITYQRWLATSMKEDPKTKRARGAESDDDDPPLAWDEVVLVDLDKQELEDEQFVPEKEEPEIDEAAKAIDPLGIVKGPVGLRDTPVGAGAGAAAGAKGGKPGGNLWSKLKKKFVPWLKGKGHNAAMLLTLRDEVLTGSVSVAKENFNPVEFLAKVHPTSRLDALQNGLELVATSIANRHTQLRALVKEHFSQYVHCKDTIDLIHMLLQAELANGQASSSRTARLKAVLDTVTQLSDNVYAPLIARRDRSDRILNTLKVMKPFRFLFTLPGSIKQNLKSGNYEAVVRDYKKAKHLSVPAGMEVVSRVLNEVFRLVEECRLQLLQQLNNPRAYLEHQQRVIGYLVDLDCAVDPSWYYLQKQHEWIGTLLDQCVVDHLDRIGLATEFVIRAATLTTLSTTAAATAAASASAAAPAATDDRKTGVGANLRAPSVKGTPPASPSIRVSANPAQPPAAAATAGSAAATNTSSAAASSTSSGGATGGAVPVLVISEEKLIQGIVIGLGAIGVSSVGGPSRPSVGSIAYSMNPTTNAAAGAAGAGRRSIRRGSFSGSFAGFDESALAGSGGGAGGMPDLSLPAPPLPDRPHAARPVQVFTPSGQFLRVGGSSGTRAYGGGSEVDVVGRETSVNRLVRRLSHVMTRNMPDFFSLAANIATGRFSTLGVVGANVGANGMPLNPSTVRLNSLLGMLGESRAGGGHSPLAVNSNGLFSNSNAIDDDDAAAAAAERKRADVRSLIANINRKYSNYIRAAIGLASTVARTTPAAAGAAAASGSNVSPSTRTRTLISSAINNTGSSPAMRGRSVTPVAATAPGAGPVVIGYRPLSGLAHDNVYTVLKSVDTLRKRSGGVVPADTMLDVFPLLSDDVVRHFTAHVFRNTLLSVVALRSEEDWTTPITSVPGITRLPELFKGIMNRCITSLDALAPVTKTKPMVEAIIAPFLECVRSFADVLHALAFDPASAARDIKTAGEQRKGSTAVPIARASVAPVPVRAMASSMGAMAMYDNPPPATHTPAEQKNNDAADHKSGDSADGPASPGAGAAGTMLSAGRLEDRQLLACLMNGIYTTESVIPALYNRLKPLLPPNLLKQIEPHYNRVMDLMEALESVLFNRYVRTKTLTLNSLIRHGLFLTGVAWSESPEPVGVRGHILELCLQLVFIHNELYRCTQHTTGGLGLLGGSGGGGGATSAASEDEIGARSLERIVEHVFTTFCECVKQIDSFDENGADQLLLEANYLKQILDNHFTEATDGAYDTLVSTLKEFIPSERERACMDRRKALLAKALAATKVMFTSLAPPPKPSAGAAGGKSTKAGQSSSSASASGSGGASAYRK